MRGPGVAVGSLDGRAGGGRRRLVRDRRPRAPSTTRGASCPIGRRAHVLTTASGRRGLTRRDRERAQGLAVRPQRDGRRRRAGRSWPPLVELNEDAAADWARRRGISVSTYAALAANEQVSELVDGRGPGRKRRLAPSSRVLAFRILVGAPARRAHADRKDPARDRRAPVRGPHRRHVRRAGADPSSWRSRRCVTRV